MKLYPAIVLSLLLALPGTAKADEWIDVVHLKNGGVVRGVIVEQVPGKSLKIETRDGNVLIFKMEEVEKLVRERSRPTAKPPEPPPKPPEPPLKPKPQPPPTKPPEPPLPPGVRRLGIGGTLTSGIGLFQLVSNPDGTTFRSVKDVTFIPVDLTVGLLLSYGEQDPEHLFGLGFRQTFASSNGSSSSNLDILLRYRLRYRYFSAGGGLGLDTGPGGATFALSAHAGIDIYFTRQLGLAIDVLNVTAYLGSAKSLLYDFLVGPAMRFFF